MPDRVVSVALRQLLAVLEPRLLPLEYVFCVVAPDNAIGVKELLPLAMFREEEGLTLVLERCVAEQAGLSYSSAFRCITLGVNSSLDDVGVTAAVTARLARHSISANVIAAYHHDHVFVPAGRAEEALVLLQASWE